MRAMKVVICNHCKGHGIKSGYRGSLQKREYVYYEETCNCCLGSGRMKETRHTVLKAEPYRQSIMREI